MHITKSVVGRNTSELSYAGGKVFFSYDIAVAVFKEDPHAIEGNDIVYIVDPSPSISTTKHINKWLGTFHYDLVKQAPETLFFNLSVLVDKYILEEVG